MKRSPHDKVSSPRRLKRFAGFGGLICALSFSANAAVSATQHFAQGQGAKIEGFILSRDGGTLRLREDSNLVARVVLADQMKVQARKGALKFRRTAMDMTALVPGLRVDVDGKGDVDGNLLAEKITFNPDDFTTAKTVDTRVSPLEGQQAELDGRQNQTEQDVKGAQRSADQANAGVADLHSRVSSLDDYETKDTATVLFATNKSDLSDQAKKDLDQLVQQALPLKGYMIEVTGYADTTGDAKRNQQLSEERAEAVVRYLQQVGQVPLRRIVASAGLGTSQSVGDNTTAEGREKNRRVEVRVILNKGQSAGPA